MQPHNTKEEQLANACNLPIIIAHAQHPAGPSCDYYQIQGQLAITKLVWCDFFVWTPAGYTVEHIRADSIFWEDIKGKLIRFHREAILPELVLPHYTHGQPIGYQCGARPIAFLFEKIHLNCSSLELSDLTQMCYKKTHFIGKRWENTQSV